MRIYSYININLHRDATDFTNTYLVTNDDTKQALLIDPCKITVEIVDQIETGPYQLAGVLITQNFRSLAQSIPAIQKIYGTVIYAADYDVAKNATSVLRDEGSLHVAGMDVSFISVPGHSPDSIIYKIGHVIFTGDVLSAGHLGTTVSNYSRRTLVANIDRKVCCYPDSTILIPAHGPPP